VKRTEAIAGRFRKLREESGLTQAQVAERAGVHAQTISEVERGARRPSNAWLLAVALKLGWEPVRITRAFAGLSPSARAVKLTPEIDGRGWLPWTDTDRATAARLGWKKESVGAAELVEFCGLARAAGLSVVLTPWAVE